MIDKIAKEAAKIMKENPNLKHYEAVIEAKKALKEKEPIAGKQNRSLENNSLY